MNIQTSKPVDQAVAAIDALDLDPMKIKLMDLEDGYGWTRAKADQTEVEYRRFLTLLAKYPEHTIAPSKDVDKFWHAHILDTLKYAEDCELVFGYFLHHFPYFGMRGEEDAANLARAADTTAELYQREFGSVAAGSTAYCGKAQTVAYCGKAQSAAYCGAVQAAAYCGASQKAAYCGKAQDSAYCGKAVDVAYCGKASASAYCGRLNVSGSDGAFARPDVMRSSVRPSL